MQSLTSETSHKLANMGFICSLFVVLIHVWVPSPEGSPAWWIYSMTDFRNIAVPFFFLMSGFLLAGHIGEDGWWGREVLKRVRSLLTPYLIWCALWIIFLLCRQIVNAATYGGSVLSDVGSMVFDPSFWGLDLFAPPRLMPLWYVRSLLILVVCSPILMWGLKRNAWLVLGLAFIKLFLYKGEEIGTWYYLFDRTFALGFVFYFMLGMALRKGLISFCCNGSAVAVGAAAVAVELVFHGIYAILGYDLECLPRLLRFAYLRLGVIDTLLWLWFFWRVMPSCELPRVLKGTAFPVYLVHWFVLVGIWQYYFCEIPGTVIELLISVVVGILGTFTVIFLLRLAPTFYSALFGQRGA